MKSSFPLRFPPSLTSFGRAGKARRAEGGCGGNSARRAQLVPFGYFQTDTASVVPPEGVEPSTSAPKADVISVSPQGQYWGWERGREPAVRAYRLMKSHDKKRASDPCGTEATDSTLSKERLSLRSRLFRVLDGDGRRKNHRGVSIFRRVLPLPGRSPVIDDARDNHRASLH